ncbi:GL18821 [Drosophila persimilis]|uniref:GL18821 n=1 Tax=Drosophila persimilis TaxID=7234 RepID=B4G8K2_DROPE|nr:GL18821 [Drosophila persimilis]
MSSRPSPIPTFKCVIVGKEGCGKSTFIHRHLTGHFEQKYLPTFGITVIKLIFPTTRGPICFEMWEGGKAEYVQYRNPFFKNVQCAIVMFDLSLKDPFKNFDEYYSMSNMLPSDILKFVCGNKADQELGNPSPLPTNIHRCHCGVQCFNTSDDGMSSCHEQVSKGFPLLVFRLIRRSVRSTTAVHPMRPADITNSQPAPAHWTTMHTVIFNEGRPIKYLDALHLQMTEHTTATQQPCDA